MVELKALFLGMTCQGMRDCVCVCLAWVGMGAKSIRGIGVEIMVVMDVECVGGNWG